MERFRRTAFSARFSLARELAVFGRMNRAPALSKITHRFSGIASIASARIRRERRAHAPVCNADLSRRRIGWPRFASVPRFYERYALTAEALINQPISRDLISDQKSRDR